MASRDLYPQEILQVVLDKSCAKAQSSIPTLAILSVLAGGYIGFGYLAYLKVVSSIPHEWGGVATLLGAAVFPIRLDLYPAWRRRAGNQQYDDYVFRQIGRTDSSKMLLRNWVIVCMGNLVGTLAMAFFLGYYVGMIEGSVAEKTIAVAEAKVHMDFGRAFVSAVACNWMVCMGAWLHFAAKNTTGRMLAIWFPVMIFVLNGFQHLVANMFVIPAGILAGANITWGQFFFNMIPVFLGNVVGGASFVGASYLYTYKDTLKDSTE